MVRSLLPTESRELAEALGVSEEAVALARSSEVVDLHLDTFIPIRMWGYDVRVRHGLGLLRGRFFGHFDIPRALDGGLSAAMWSITTNPFRSAPARWQTFLDNVARLREVIGSSSGTLRVARSLAEYREVRGAGAHACLLAIQGGNALDGALLGARELPDRLITRVTLLHLTNSSLGATSTPLHLLRRDKGLSARGKMLVEQLDAERIFVDLAHVHPEGFWDAVEVHDPSLPLIATHTGVSGVTPHWRNLDDEQLRAIADTGGVVGVIYSRHFLHGRHGFGDARMVVEHLAHIVDTIGEDFAAIGSDHDGAIMPPPDLRGVDRLPVLVQRMLERGWREERIRKILGLNFLRAFGELRPE
jgi:membrane dipeptidase